MIRPLIGVAVLAVLAATAGVPGAGLARAETLTCEELTETDLPPFALPSTQDRLVTYERDYYGKHALVLTFFPAAFTPV
ncbi:MAG: hypothetical protein Kow0092_16530 [Deferrisomatales bacterium]